MLIVDELAHTNVPGVTHTKRWQDVVQLLDAGIDVYTTLNVQHLESLNDVIAQISGVVVRETVPDSVFEHADEVELVDLSPDDLLERLREGKIYVAPEAERAMANFFAKGNLIALRELALRRTAERVGDQMDVYRDEHAVQRNVARPRAALGLRRAEPLLRPIGPRNPPHGREFEIAVGRRSYRDASRRPLVRRREGTTHADASSGRAAWGRNGDPHRAKRRR